MLIERPFDCFQALIFFLRFSSKAYCAQSSPDRPFSLKNDREVLDACIGSAQWHPLKSLQQSISFPILPPAQHSGLKQRQVNSKGKIHKLQQQIGQPLASSACSCIIPSAREVQCVHSSSTVELIQGKKQPSPEPVFALTMAQCPGLVQGGSLHWELHAAGACTRRKRCEMRASGRQIPNRCLFTSSRDHPKPLTLPVQAAQSVVSSQGIWLSTLHCDHRIITAFSANSTSSIADCLRRRSRQNKGEDIM